MKLLLFATGVAALVSLTGAIASEDVKTVPPSPAQPPAAAALASDFPQWAFPGPKNVGLAGSTQKYSMVTMFDRTRAVDWYPDSHPAMPAIVKGHLPVFACGFCHLPEGAGRPENAALAGLPADYFLRQIAEFKSGARKPSDPKFGPAWNMIGSLHQIPDSDFEAAAKYYSGLKYTRHMKLIESATAPHHTSNGFVYEFEAGPAEPLGDRIIEGPESFEAFEMRDPNQLFDAYIPIGAVARGAELAKGNGGDRPACQSCHGDGLKGGPIGPPIAGRLPTGLFRQLYAFHTGDRNGAQAVLMKPVVTGLTQKQMIDLSAYVASLEP